MGASGRWFLRSCTDRVARTLCVQIDASRDTSCGGRGTMVGGKCKCISGYAGFSCQYPVCYSISSDDQQVCSSNGACASPNNCVCNAGYTGVFCHIRACGQGQICGDIAPLIMRYPYSFSSINVAEATRVVPVDISAYVAKGQRIQVTITVTPATMTEVYQDGKREYISLNGNLVFDQLASPIFVVFYNKTNQVSLNVTTYVSKSYCGDNICIPELGETLKTCFTDCFSLGLVDSIPANQVSQIQVPSTLTGLTSIRINQITSPCTLDGICDIPPLKEGTYQVDLSFNQLIFTASKNYIKAVPATSAEITVKYVNTTTFSLSWTPTFTGLIDITAAIVYSTERLETRFLHLVIASNIPNTGNYVATLPLYNITTYYIVKELSFSIRRGTDIQNQRNIAILPLVLAVAVLAPEILYALYWSVGCYGNYCGKQVTCLNQPTLQQGVSPIDNGGIDSVCYEHDKCYDNPKASILACDMALVRDLPAAAEKCDLQAHPDCKFYAWRAVTLFSISISKAVIVPVVTTVWQMATPIRASWGDPHFSTIDGCPFTFNGAGEYTLIQTKSDSRFTIQVRNQVFNGGTLTTGIAVQDGAYGVTINLLATPTSITTLINGAETNILRGVQYLFASGTLISNSQQSYTLSFFDGTKIDVQSNSYGIISSLSIALAKSTFFNNTTGLLGTWDDNKDNDFIPRNGGTAMTCAEAQSKSAQVFQFGRSWGATITSLFMDASFNSFNTLAETAKSFTPVLDPTKSSKRADQALIDQARVICSTMPPDMVYGCMYDYLVIDDGSDRLMTVNAVLDVMAAESIIPSNITVQKGTQFVMISWDNPQQQVNTSIVRNEVQMLQDNMWRSPYSESQYTLYTGYNNITLTANELTATNQTKEFMIRVRSVVLIRNEERFSDWSAVSFQYATTSQEDLPSVVPSIPQDATNMPGISTGAWVGIGFGIAIGVLVVVAIIIGVIVAVICVVRKKQAKQTGDYTLFKDVEMSERTAT
jgi:hypothetical protein